MYRTFTRPLGPVFPSARVALTVLALILVFSAGVGWGRLANPNTAFGSQRYADLDDLDAYETLEQTYALIREEYVLSGDVTDDDLIYGASAGMMESLGDSDHSRFLDPQAAETYYASLAGSEYVGIGIQVDDTETPPVVTMPIADSPALEAGILPGDQILAVDGIPTSSFTDPSQAVDQILGEAGTEVTLEVLHPGETESIELTITRRGVIRAPVDWIMLPDNVAWVRVNAFNEGAGEGVVAALEEGRQLGAEGVILDLRGNPGGLVTEEMEIASQFLPAGSIVFQSQDADGVIEEVTVTAREGAWRDRPVVVLINNDSVSAAEVTAAAIERNDRGITIGQTTFGTGTGLALYDLDDGSLVMIGFEMWLTPDGETIWHTGLEPLVNVANSPAVPLVLPYQFDDTVVSRDQLARAGDTQLQVAFDVVTAQVEDGAYQPPVPAAVSLERQESDPEADEPAYRMA
jgi:carboxyl-terminal processing protease